MLDSGSHLDRLVLIDMATKHGRQGMGTTGARLFPHRHGEELLPAWKNDGYLLNTEERSGYLGQPIDHRCVSRRMAAMLFAPSAVWMIPP